MAGPLMNFLKFFPILSIVFTSWVCATMLTIGHGINYAFAFMAFQFYANWIVILHTNNPWKKSDIEPVVSNNQQLWFCTKCDRNYPFNVEHCPLCKKCTAHRDHHCFFLGTCIISKNMKYFIVILFYTTTICFYVIHTLVPYLCTIIQHGVDVELSGWQLVLKFVYPVMFVRWLLGQETLYLVSLSTMFGLLVSVGCTTLCYLIFQCHRIATGAVYKNRPPGTHTSVADNLVAVFGKWGFLNLLFPVITSEVTQLNFHLPIHQS